MEIEKDSLLYMFHIVETAYMLHVFALNLSEILLFGKFIYPEDNSEPTKKLFLEPDIC